MATKFKGVQQQILTSQNANILVSAGAGSGKTTVMIEKISSLIIEQKVPVNNLLVVTFTVLAAQEMKDRLVKKLNSLLKESTNKEEILHLIQQVKTANIDTIDGFASKTIKKYFYALGINPNINILSDATKDYFINQAMKKTVDEYQQNQAEFTQLLDIFSGDERNLNRVEELALKTYENIINLQDYEAFLKQTINEYSAGGVCEQFVNTFLKNKIAKAHTLSIQETATLTQEEQTEQLNFVKALEGFNKKDDLLKTLEKINNLILPQIKSRQANNLKQAINIVKDIQKELQKEGISTDYKQKNAQIVGYLTNFLKFLINFINNYTSIKQKNNLIDFNDLNRLMIKLLENEKVQNELQTQFSHIFVDEYQDVNPLQDYIISKLVGKNTKLFLVGDVKQSIYGFRGAQPSSFLGKYNSINKNENLGQAFNMNVNFRSNPKILNYINQVFGDVMTQETADINYKQDCEIEPQKKEIDDIKPQILLAKEGEKSVASGTYSVKNAPVQSSTNGEDLLVLTAIMQMIKTPFYDSNLGVVRPLDYGDIAILSRSCEDEAMHNLISFLKSKEVPVRTTSKLDVSSNEGVKLVMSVFKCLVALADDVDYFAVFNALTNLTIEELANIKQKDKSFYDSLLASTNQQVKCGFKKLEQISLASTHLTNSQLIRYILNECGLKDTLICKPNGKMVLDDIEAFISTISPLEDGQNISEFVSLIQSNLKKNNEVESLDDENSVIIQNIHKSKGLEYPVVILYNTSKNFKYITDNSLINFNSEMGLGVEYYNTELRTKTNSIVHYAIKLNNNIKSYKEEMRLLYVALTRAKNKLIITGSYNDNLLEKPRSNTNFLNMLLSPFKNLKEGENNFEYCDIHLLDEVKEPEVMLQLEERKVIDAYSNFEYLNKEKFAVPLKNTVTGLNSEYSQKQGFSTKQWLKPSTQYLQDEDRALLGTHYHKALEMLDYNSAYSKTTNFEDVDYSKIKQAHEKIAPLTTGATLHKEAEFMMYVPYNELVKSSVQEKVLVQGVVDLIIEKPTSLIIVDYKFSSLPLATLKQKYAEQLNLYKLASEKAFNKKVEKTLIYSINSGEFG